MPVTTRTYAIAATSVAAIAIVAMVLATSRPDDPYAACRKSRISGGAGAIGGAFTLTDEDGMARSDAEVLAKPSLVYFGYTFCPDVCPIDAARNADAVDALEVAGHEVTPVFISVDPDRDTAAVLKDWTGYIHPRLIGLTGTPDQIKAVGALFKTFYRVPENPVDPYYLIDHMTHTYLMLPGTGFAEFFGRDVPAQEMADRVGCFLDATG